MNSRLQKLKKITKNKEESIKLLKSALKRETFLEYIFTYFDKDELFKEVNFSKFDIKLSELEFQQPSSVEHYPLIWSVLEKENFSSIEATNPINWLSISLQMVENNIIEPYYFAFVDKNKDGKKNIAEALRYVNQGDDKRLFEICRAILRHMFGAIQERGKNAIYIDIPFAIVWWTMYFAKEAEKNSNVESSKIIKYFLNNKTAYNNFIEKGRELTIIFDKNIRDGLFLHVIAQDDLKVKEFKDITSKIGIESSCRSLGSLTAQDNKMIIQSIA